MSLCLECIALNEEEKLCFRDSERTKEYGWIGYLRGDFGRSGEEFHSTWFEGDKIKKMIIDNATPIAQGHLPNNTRITVLKSPIVDDDRGIAASIRMLHPQRVDRVSLIRTEAITEEMLSGRYFPYYRRVCKGEYPVRDTA